MQPNVTALERAFELARSGRCRNMKEIGICLEAEGYSQSLVVGKYLLAQLRQLMLDADPASYGFSIALRPPLQAQALPLPDRWRAVAARSACRREAHADPGRVRSERLKPRGVCYPSDEWRR